MPWFRVDDQFPNHPKVLKAGEDTLPLWLAGGCYASAHSTDGFIPAEALPRLITSRKVTAYADRLVDAGLWERVPGGFQIHQFTDYNPTKDETEERREAIRQKRREAGKMGGLARAANASNGQANASSKPKQTQASDPSTFQAPTRPDPTPLLTPLPPKGGKRNRVDPAAAAVLVDLNASRLRAIPGARELRPTPENLRHIADRLAAGATIDDCRHVIAVREAEVRAKPDAAQWFDAVTPFRPDQFAKALAATAGTSAAAGSPERPIAHQPLPRLTRPA